VGAVVSGLLAGLAARRLTPRVVVTAGLSAIGLALGALTVLSQETPYLYLGGVLLLVGAGAGFSFTVTADLILGNAPKENAGAASAVSETAYELGAALGIALLGSVITGVYRGHVRVPAEVSGSAADGARESLAGAAEVARGVPGPAAERLAHSANEAFLEGLRIAAGAGAAVLLSAAVAAWFMLRGARTGGGDIDH